MKIKSIDTFPIVMPLKAVLNLPIGASCTLAEGKQNILVRITDEDAILAGARLGPRGAGHLDHLEKPSGPVPGLNAALETVQGS